MQMTTRETRYLKRIQQLVNMLQRRVAEVNHLDARLRFAEAKVMVQRDRLHIMNMQAHNRNKEIVRLRNLNNSVTITPIPQFRGRITSSDK